MSEVKLFLQKELYFNVSEKKVPKHLNPVIAQKLAGKKNVLEF